MYYLLIFYNTQSGQIYNYFPVEDDSNDTLRIYCYLKITHICPAGSYSSYSLNTLLRILKSVNISYYFYNLEDIKNIIRGLVN